jgi:hypothetical protein
MRRAIYILRSHKDQRMPKHIRLNIRLRRPSPIPDAVSSKDPAVNFDRAFISGFDPGLSAWTEASNSTSRHEAAQFLGLENYGPAAL